MKKSDRVAAQQQRDGQEEVYHERQSMQRCAMHAMNNLLQRRAFEPKDLDKLCSPEGAVADLEECCGMQRFEARKLINEVSRHPFFFIARPPPFPSLHPTRPPSFRYPPFFLFVRRPALLLARRLVRALPLGVYHMSFGPPRAMQLRRETCARGVAV